MKATILMLALVATVLDTASAQQPPSAPGVPPPTIRGRIPSAYAPANPEDAELTRNYRLTVTFKTSEKDSREVSLLTSSSRISLNTSLAGGDPALGTIIVEVSGILAEKEDGRLRFSYHIGGQIPLASEPQPSNAPGSNAPQSYRSVQYIPESVTGTLTIEPGRSYEVFKSGARSYTISISPETAEKQK